MSLCHLGVYPDGPTLASLRLMTVLEGWRNGRNNLVSLPADRRVTSNGSCRLFDTGSPPRSSAVGLRRILHGDPEPRADPIPGRSGIEQFRGRGDALARKGKGLP